LPLFRLAHLSDLHLPPPPAAMAARAGLKGRLSRLAWRRKSHRHDPQALTAVVADIRAYRPDHWVITGDLTNFSTAEELAAARDWLEALAPAQDLTVSPGNHDALVGADEDRFAPWSPWLGDNASAQFPQVRRRAGVAVVNLCSAVATAPHLATGRLGKDQLERLDQQLRDLAEADLFTVLLLHHPPRSGVVDERKALVDAQALGEILARRGAGLVLHGHAHTAAVGALPGPRGPIVVLGAPSASAVGDARHPGARWHGIEINRSGGQTQVRVIARATSPSSGAEPLGAYSLTLT
jgi:3',5'-cyclic AMP phosphodiesterase CpdA